MFLCFRESSTSSLVGLSYGIDQPSVQPTYCGCGSPLATLCSPMATQMQCTLIAQYYLNCLFDFPQIWSTNRSITTFNKVIFSETNRNKEQLQIWLLNINNSRILVPSGENICVCSPMATVISCSLSTMSYISVAQNEPKIC